MGDPFLRLLIGAIFFFQGFRLFLVSIIFVTSCKDGSPRRARCAIRDRDSSSFAVICPCLVGQSLVVG